MIQRAVRRVYREIRQRFGRAKLQKDGVEFSPPNYVYKNRFSENSVVVDVGCASDPDLSLFMMKKFGVTAIAVDPTQKHREALQQIEKTHSGKFKHLPLALANQDSTLTFHESEENDSGSLLSSHSNIVNDKTRSYEVEAVTLPTLLSRVGKERLDFLKLDLEGIEYQLLSELTESDLEAVDQLFVEFHHHCIPEFTRKDTQRLVQRISGFGFQSITIDDANFLFWRA